MDKYIVAYYDPTDSWRIGPVEVHVRPGETTKDVQDKIAGFAGEHPELIYFVVLEDDFRQYYRDKLQRAFGGRHNLEAS
jgi:hypothetical protein